MHRRELLKAGTGLAAAVGLPAISLPVGAQTRAIPWQNWSGYLRCEPQARMAPADTTEMAALLKRSQGTVRPVGAGHSFSGLVPTDGTIVSLRHFSGLLDHDPEAMTATLGAGTKLGQMGELLQPIGQALPNMPDVDEQSLAGAMATGTHGTGRELGALHAYIDALQLVTPTGNVLELSREQDADVFAAAQVSLGALGVITQYRLRNVAPYSLRRQAFLMPIEELLAEFPSRIQNHRGFEMFYIPFSGHGLAITTDITTDPPSPRGEDQDNSALEDLRLLRDLLSWSPLIREKLFSMIAALTFEAEDNVDLWYRIYPSDRAVRFNEMEYHIPQERIPEALAEVRSTLEARHPEVFFPIEVRVTAPDDAWLSPFQGEPRGSIAVHRVHDEDPLPVQRTVEPIFRKYGGRPHWGKMHTLSSRDCAELYPRWQDFARLRAELDPQGRMLNDHLRQLFGLPA